MHDGGKQDGAIIQKDLQVSGGILMREEALLLACICIYLEKAFSPSFMLSSVHQNKDDPPTCLQRLYVTSRFGLTFHRG